MQTPAPSAILIPEAVKPTAAGPSSVEVPSSAPAAAYSLPRIPYLCLRLILRAVDHARLPPYKGSLLRGAFGHALRAAVCAMGPSQPCASCRLRPVCVYTRLFETFVEHTPPPFLRGLPTSPRPYVFEPTGDEREFPPGAALQFDLVLIGQAVALQQYALLAIERMASAGLGRDRFRFALESATYRDPGGTWQELAHDGESMPPAPAPSLLPPAVVDDGAGAVLHFLTPTRIKVHDHLAPTIAFRPLVFAMLRRVLELAYCHVPDSRVDWTFRPLLERAQAVRIVVTDLRWHDWQRYSNRQRTAMTLGGFVGTIEVEGDLSPFWPLLRTAEVVHLGKGATFGLGKLAIVART
jgi:CRISPR-associated endoribonuclease Cas6